MGSGQAVGRDGDLAVPGAAAGLGALGIATPFLRRVTEPSRPLASRCTRFKNKTKQLAFCV